MAGPTKRKKTNERTILKRKNTNTKKEKHCEDEFLTFENQSSEKLQDFFKDMYISSKEIWDAMEVEERKNKPRSNKRYIKDNSSRVATFLKRRRGLMKKAYELAVTTRSQILLICVPEKKKSIYTFSTHKFKPFITDFKAIIVKYLENREEFHSEQREFFGLVNNEKEETIRPRYVYNDDSSSYMADLLSYDLSFQKSFFYGCEMNPINISQNSDFEDDDIDSKE